MTIHVVSLDGTGQVKLQPHPSNIARIFDALGGPCVDGGNGSFETNGEGITGKYLPGVGTQGDPVLKILGNGWGDGIAESIVRGYTYLSRNFRTGDQIVINGFSRGATAARALAGMIVSRGLLAQGTYNSDNKTEAYLRGVAAWYAYRKPNGLVGRIGFDVISGMDGLDLPTLGDGAFTSTPQILAVGVFDTVSSLGLAIPTVGFKGIGATFDFSICNTNLHPDVLHGFHALAADETRDLFSPTFWAWRDDSVVQQIFPGCHSDVGGGFPNRGLSDGALAWMLDHLRGVGVPFAAVDTLVPPLAPNALDFAQNDAATFPFVLTPRSARAFPHIATPSQILNDRRNQHVEMLPSEKAAPYKPIGTYADGAPL